MKRAVFHPEASQEYLQAIEYYAAINPELGERFDAEVQHLVDEVSRDPLTVFPVPSTGSTRPGSQVPLLGRVSRSVGSRVDRGRDARQSRPGYWRERL